MPKLILVLFGCLSESAEYSHECLVVKCEQLNWCLCWFRETRPRHTRDTPGTLHVRSRLYIPIYLYICNNNRSLQVHIQRVATDHNMLVLYGIMSYMDFDMAGHMKVMK